METIRNRIKVEFIKKDDIEKNFETTIKINLQWSSQTYTQFDSYTFKKNEVLMGEPINLGFVALELSKLLTCETYYDKLQTFLGEKNKELHYMDADSFVLSVNTKEIIKDLKCFKDLFDFSNLFENCQLFSNRNKKVFGKYKIETPKIIWIDEFVCLRSKINAFKNGDDSKNKLKGLSKSYSNNTKVD